MITLHFTVRVLHKMINFDIWFDKKIIKKVIITISKKYYYYVWEKILLLCLGTEKVSVPYLTFCRQNTTDHFVRKVPNWAPIEPETLEIL